MDNPLLEYICVSGVVGRQQTEVQDFIKAHNLPAQCINELLRDRFISKEDNTYTAGDEFQDIFLLDNRFIDLTPMARRALGHIGASGTAGILQTDLAKALQIDNKTLFHHMKPLVRFNLITRHPVAAKKAFTYLCTLSKFFIEDTSDDIGVDRQGNADNALKVSSVVFKEAVLALLSNSKGKSFSTKQLYEQCCPEGTDVKDFRRCLLALEHDGQVEIVSTRELGGTSRLVRLNTTKPTAMATEKADDDDEEEHGENDNNLRSSSSSFSAPLLVDFVPIEKQVRDYIHDCGPDGATMNDIVRCFGLRKKFAFRLMERLVDKRNVTNTDVTRQAEFCGRERRYKFSIMSTGSNTDTCVASGDMSRDSVNRVRRQAEILRLVHEKQIVEVGRGMADVIAERLGESKHIVDVKTLKRTINLMRSMGQLQVHTVGTVTYGDRLNTRIVITGPQVKTDSEEFKLLLSKLDDKKTQDNDTAHSNDVDYVDVNKYDFGFTFGVMERLRQCHLYLANKRFSEKTSVFNTTALFFKDLPLSLFHTLVGCNAKMSPQYHTISAKDPTIRLKDLPTAVHRQVNNRLKEHKRIVHLLINLMLDLGLIQEHCDDVGVVESTRVPIGIAFCDTITLDDPFEPDDDGMRRGREYQCTSMDQVVQYWEDFWQLVRVPEEVDGVQKAERFDVRNWSNRPLNVSMMKVVEREAERIVDDSANFEDAVKQVSDKWMLDERIVTVYLEYHLSLLQPAATDTMGDTDDRSDDHDHNNNNNNHTPSPTSRRRRPRHDGFTVEESLKLKLVMSVIECEQTLFTDTSMWSFIQPLFFPNRSTDDLRRKYGNVVKSVTETTMLQAVKKKVWRLHQLHSLGLIAGKPTDENNLRTTFDWYEKMYDELQSIEASIMAEQPRSLQAARQHQWIELVVVAKDKQVTSLSDTDTLPDDVNRTRKSLLYNTTTATAMQSSGDMQVLVDCGFATHQPNDGTMKLSMKAKEWLRGEHNFLPKQLATGQPLTIENTADLDIYAVYRLYGRGRIAFTNDDDDNTVNYTITNNDTSSTSHGGGDNTFLWFDGDRLDEQVFCQCMGTVSSEIDSRPGIAKRSVVCQFLTRSEIDYLVDYLIDHDKVILVDGRLYPQ